MQQNKKEKLEGLFYLQHILRDFFCKQGFLDVLTPPMVEHPGMESHLHPFAVHSMIEPKKRLGFLHTSPEFYMKELLSLGFKKFFTLGYCFRDEPSSAHHRPQFVMLEWYRANESYENIMKDSEHLINLAAQKLTEQGHPVNPYYLDCKLKKKRIDELFQEVLNISILDYIEGKKLREYILQYHPDIPLPKEDISWEDYYFLLFLNKIEPTLQNNPALLLYEFPAPLAALSTLKKDDPRVCERFEIYLRGIELCNCFNELTDLNILKTRFKLQGQEKYARYGYRLPKPQRFYAALKQGLPPCSGIALGVERLYGALVGEENPFWD